MKKIVYALIMLSMVSCEQSAEQKAAQQKMHDDSVITQQKVHYDSVIAIQKKMIEEETLSKVENEKKNAIEKTRGDELNNQISELEKEKAFQLAIIDEANKFFATTIPCGKGGEHGKYKRKESNGNEVCSTKYGDEWYDYDQKSIAANRYIGVLDNKINLIKEKFNSK